MAKPEDKKPIESNLSDNNENKKAIVAGGETQISAPSENRLNSSLLYTMVLGETLSTPRCKNPFKFKR